MVDLHTRCTRQYRTVCSSFFVQMTQVLLHSSAAAEQPLAVTAVLVSIQGKIAEREMVFFIPLSSETPEGKTKLRWRWIYYLLMFTRQRESRQRISHKSVVRVMLS